MDQNCHDNKLVVDLLQCTLQQFEDILHLRRFCSNWDVFLQNNAKSSKFSKRLYRLFSRSFRELKIELHDDQRLVQGILAQLSFEKLNPLVNDSLRYDLQRNLVCQSQAVWCKLDDSANDDSFGNKLISCLQQNISTLMSKINTEDSNSNKLNPNNNFLYNCKNCSEKFPTSKELIFHKTNRHQLKFQCFTCKRDFHNQYLFTLHLRSSRATCNKFKSVKRKLRALKNPTFETRTISYVCWSCALMFESSKSMVAHIKIFHTANSCVQCESEFKSEKLLIRHLRTTSCSKQGPYRYRCKICKNLTYRTMKTFGNHLSSHSNQTKSSFSSWKPVTVGAIDNNSGNFINDNSASFDQDSSFEMQDSSSQHSSVNNDCSENNELNKQIDKHIEQFFCINCLQQFQFRYDLARHQKESTTGCSALKERPFKCKQCGKYFRQKFHCKMHLLRLHLNLVNPNANQENQTMSLAQPTQPSEPQSDILQAPIELNVNFDSSAIMHSTQMFSQSSNNAFSPDSSMLIPETNLSVELDYRPFRCKLCRQLFKQKIHCKTHLLKVHRDQVTENENVDDRIEKIEYQDADMDSLMDNILRSNPNGPIVDTNSLLQNNHYFLQPSMVNCNTDSDLDVRPFRCKLCNQMFKQKIHCKTHLLKVHRDHAEQKENIDESIEKVEYHTLDADSNFNQNIDPNSILQPNTLFGQPAPMINMDNDSTSNIVEPTVNRIEFRPFRCKMCSQMFKQKIHCKTHLLHVHRDRMGSNEIIDGFIEKVESQDSQAKQNQPLYQNSNIQQTSLDGYHNESNMFIPETNLSVENDNRPFRCKICSQMFKQKIHCKTHLLHVHRDRLGIMDNVDVNIEKVEFPPIQINSNFVYQNQASYIQPSGSNFNSDCNNLASEPNFKVEQEFRPFRCKICSQMFKQKIHCKTHLVHVHRDRVDVIENVEASIEKIDYYTEPLKPNIPTQGSILQSNQSTYFNQPLNNFIPDSNVGSVETDKRLCVCKFCNQSFKQKIHLRNHLLQFHRDQFQNIENMNANNNKVNHHDINQKQNDHFGSILQNNNSFAHSDSNGFNSNSTILTSHMPVADQENRPFRCKICSQMFKQKIHCKTHLVHVHRNQLESIENVDTKIEKIEHHDIVPKQVQNISQASNTSMNSESNSESEFRPFRCRLCQQMFKQKVHCKTHLLKVHKDKITSNDKIDDKIERLEFKEGDDVISISNSKQDQSFTSNEIRPYRCKLCKQLFKIKNRCKNHLLAIHRVQMEPKEATECLIEYLGGNQSNSENGRRQSSSVEVKVEDEDRCNTPKMTDQSDSDGPNMGCSASNIIVDEGGTFRCQVCRRVFQSRYNLKRHIRESSNLNLEQRPYGCKFCTRTFKQKSHCKNHLIRWHSSQMDPKTNYNVYVELKKDHSEQMHNEDGPRTESSILLSNSQPKQLVRPAPHPAEPMNNISDLATENNNHNDKAFNEQINHFLSLQFSEHN